MPEIRIRKCGPRDIALTGAFYDRVVQWLDGHVNYPKWEYRVYPSEDYVRAMTEAGGQYICTDGDTIVCAFVLNTDPQGSYGNCRWSRDLPEGSYMVLHALATAPERQGQGIASAAIRFCVDKAQSEGCLALRLDVIPDSPAKKLYEKNGFRYAGDADLERNAEIVPVFSVYELNW